MHTPKKRGSSHWKASQDGNGAKGGLSNPAQFNALRHSIGFFDAEALRQAKKSKANDAGALRALDQAVAAGAGRTLGIAPNGNAEESSAPSNAFGQHMAEETWLRKWNKHMAEPEAAWLETQSAAADEAVDLLKTGPFILGTLAAAAAVNPTEHETSSVAEHRQPVSRARRKHSQITGLSICLRAIERREEMAFERALIIFGRDISLHSFNAVSLAFIRERAQGVFPADALCMRAIAGATERWDRGLAQLKTHKATKRGWGADADYMAYQMAFWALDSVEPMVGGAQNARAAVAARASARQQAAFGLASERPPNVAETVLAWAVRQGAPGATPKFWEAMGLHERSRWTGFGDTVKKAIENAGDASGARHETAQKAWEQRAFGLATRLWREAGELGPDIMKDRVLRASFWASAREFVEGRVGAAQRELAAGTHDTEKNTRGEIIRAAARAMDMFPVDEPPRKVERWISDSGAVGPMFFAMMESEKIKRVMDATEAAQGLQSVQTDIGVQDGQAAMGDQGVSIRTDSTKQTEQLGAGASPRPNRRPRSL